MREISVEEGVGMLHLDIVRTQGLEGQVTVDMATEPGSAQTTADVNKVELVPVQVKIFKYNTLLFLSKYQYGFISASFFNEL